MRRRAQQLQGRLGRHLEQDVARLDQRAAAKQLRALRIKGAASRIVGGRHAHFLREQRFDAVVNTVALHAEAFGFFQQQPAQHQFMHGLLQRVAGTVVMRQFLRDVGIVDIDAIDGDSHDVTPFLTAANQLVSAA
ncbi:hypothetical protein D3C85_292130 [compost metagenome]